MNLILMELTDDEIEERIEACERRSIFYDNYAYHDIGRNRVTDEYLELIKEQRRRAKLRSQGYESPDW